MFNGNLTIAEGAIRPYNRVNADAWYLKRLAAVAEAHDFSLRTPVKGYPKKCGTKFSTARASKSTASNSVLGDTTIRTYEGVIPNLERRWKDTESEFMRKGYRAFYARTSLLYVQRCAPDLLYWR